VCEGVGYGVDFGNSGGVQEGVVGDYFVSVVGFGMNGDYLDEFWLNVVCWVNFGC